MKSSNDLVIRQIHGAILQLGDFPEWSTAYVRTMLPYVTDFGVNPTTRRRGPDCITGGRDPNFELGPDQVLVLNREYKPLGVAAYKPHVTYSEWPCVVDLPSRSEFKHGAHGSDRVHPLYQDHFTPWTSMESWQRYTKRLHVLLADLGAPGEVQGDLRRFTQEWCARGVCTWATA